MKFLQGCKKELSALANRAIRLCKQLVCHVSAISNQSLNSKDKLLLKCLQCIFFWQLEINCFITEILHALHADMLLLNCILAYLAALFSDQQEFAGIRHPMPSSGKRPQYVVHMKAINARRESETWVTELPCSLLTFVFDKTQEQCFLDPLTSWLSNFYYISLD